MVLFPLFPVFFPTFPVLFPIAVVMAVVAVIALFPAVGMAMRFGSLCRQGGAAEGHEGDDQNQHHAYYIVEFLHRYHSPFQG